MLGAGFFENFKEGNVKISILYFTSGGIPKSSSVFFELGNHRSLCGLINKVSFLSHAVKGNEEITVTENLEELDLIVYLGNLSVLFC